MGVRVREIDVGRESDVLLPVLRENLPGHEDDRQFRWLYLDNPYGKARAWLAFDEADGSAVGAAAAFPRLMRVDDEDVLCWNLGDFAIAPDRRSLGPAVALQRACLRDVLDGRVPFAYDHPSCNMMAVYRWLKIAETGSAVRHARLLKADDLVERRLGVGRGSRLVAWVGNAVLAMTDLRPHASAAHRVRPLEDAFGPEFADLERRVRGRHRVFGARTPEYLNWRYRAIPDRRHDVLVAEREGSLAGYLVLRRYSRSASIVDLFGEPEPTVAASLVRAVLDTLRGTDVQTLSFPVLETSPLVPLLRRWAFRPRERANFVVSTRPGSPLAGIVADPLNWFHTDGDRDV